MLALPGAQLPRGVDKHRVGQGLGFVTPQGGVGVGVEGPEMCYSNMLLAAAYLGALLPDLAITLHGDSIIIPIFSMRS